MYLLSRQPPSLLFMLKKKIRCIFLENPNKITILSLQLVQESTILLHQQLTHTRTIQLVIQPTSSPLFSLFNPLEFVHAFMPSCSGASNFYVYVLQIVAGPFLLFLLAIVLPIPLRYTILITPMVSSNFSLKGVSRSVHSRTVRRKQTKRQIIVNKTLHRKLMMGHEAQGQTQVLQNGKQFLLHLWHSYISQYRNETTNKGNNKITELRTILQRESQSS